MLRLSPKPAAIFDLTIRQGVVWMPDLGPGLRPADEFTNRFRTGRRAVMTAEAEPAGTQRILIVDDSATARRFAEKVLTSAGYEVQTLDNHWMARTIAEFRPALALVDVNLGRATLDGATAVRAVRSAEFARQTRFVLYSTMDAEQLRELAADCGADAWLAKDGNADRLIRWIRQFLQP